MQTVRSLYSQNDDPHSILAAGVDPWNQWRQCYPKLTPNLRGAKLRGAKLSGANLTGANLIEADLRDADLSGADLSNAMLSDTDLSNANLSCADLSGVRIYRTTFVGADLSGANLPGTNRNAFLDGANLTGTIGMNTTFAKAGKTMSEFLFPCPHCDQHLEASEDLSDMFIDCPSCSKQIRVPATPAQKKAAKELPKDMVTAKEKRTPPPKSQTSALLRKCEICGAKVKTENLVRHTLNCQLRNGQVCGSQKAVGEKPSDRENAKLWHAGAPPSARSKLLCFVGWHKWNGCRCLTCGKARDQDHTWCGYVCSKCGKLDALRRSFLTLEEQNWRNLQETLPFHDLDEVVQIALEHAGSFSRDEFEYDTGSEKIGESWRSWGYRIHRHRGSRFTITNYLSSSGYLNDDGDYKRYL